MPTGKSLVLLTVLLQLMCQRGQASPFVIHQAGPMGEHVGNLLCARQVNCAGIGIAGACDLSRLLAKPAAGFASLVASEGLLDLAI